MASAVAAVVVVEAERQRRRRLDNVHRRRRCPLIKFISVRSCRTDTPTQASKRHLIVNPVLFLIKKKECHLMRLLR